MNQVKFYPLACFVLMICLISTAHGMIPDFYSEAASTNKRSAVSLAPNEVIDPFSGTLNLVHTDLVVPGEGGMDIVIQRSYSSNNVYQRPLGSSQQRLEILNETTPYGVGWSLHFGRVRISQAYFDDVWRFNRSCSINNGVDSSVDDNPVLEMPDGSQKVLFCNDYPSTYNTNADFITKDHWAVNTIDTSAGTQGFEVIDNNGMKYTMTKRLLGGVTGDQNTYVWYTTQIEDRNGNTININYDNESAQESPIYRSITSSDGRTVTFTYTSKTNPFKAQLRRISYGNKQIDYNFSRLIPDYSVSGGREYRLLRSVDLPGAANSTGRWDYTYYNRARGQAGDNVLQRITYPQGATTTYDYDYQCFLYNSCARVDQYFSLVVKSKVNAGRAVASGTWRFAYSSTSNDTLDITTITGPTSVEEYRHHRVDQKLNLTTTYNNIVPQLWRVGMLAQKKISDRAGNLLQTENYTYANRRISNEIFERYPYTQSGVNIKDIDVFQPYITQKSITRDGKTYITKYESFTDNINPHKVTEIGQETKVTNLTYYPRINGQNIVNQVKNEVIVNVASRRILRTFDSKGRVTNENNYGVPTSYTYYGNGNVLTMKDARNKTTRFESYFRGIARTEKRPEAVTIRRSVDTHGNVTRLIDGNNRITDYTYDGLNRLTSINHPRGSDVSISWTTSKRTLTRGSYSQVVDFDGFGRTTCTKTENVHVGQAYNSVGNQTHKTYPNYSSCAASNTRTRFTYDALNRPRRTTHPDNSFREITYLSNNRQRLRDERGKLFTNTYRSFSDPDNQEMTRITGPESLDVRVALNILGQPTSVNRNGVNRAFGYGSTVFLTSEVNPETGTTTYGRDALGNMISKKVGTSATTRYTYDDLNRLERVNYPGSTPDVAMTYDKNSNLKTVNSGLANLTYTYDANNNLEKEQQRIGGVNYFLNFTYNGLDHVSSMSYPDNGEVTYAPNDLGWPTKAAPYVTNVTYNAAGQPTAIAYQNGRTTTHSYWARLWPRGTAVNGSISNRIHTYDAAGNKTSVDDRINNLYDLNMSYDDLNRVKTANGAWGNGSVTYSTDDDITAKRMGSNQLTYSYSANNRISSVSGIENFITPAQYAYDVYGNITQKANNSVGWTYEYDDASNLRRVFNKAGTRLRLFDYSGQKQRVRTIKSDETRIHIVGKDGQLYSEYVTRGTKPNLVNVYLGNRLVAELENAVNGTPAATVFGWGFGNSANKYDYTRSFTLDRIPARLKYCVNGYGINSNTEVSVTLNGTLIGYMLAGANPKETCFDIDRSLLNVGTNTVLFTQTRPVQTWGVGGFVIDASTGAETMPAIMLLLDDEVPDANQATTTQEN